MNTRNYIEKLMYPYLDGTATSGKAPLRHTQYGSFRSMKFDGPLLYSYATMSIILIWTLPQWKLLTVAGVICHQVRRTQKLGLCA